jgi:hypothetical protein
MRSAVAIIWMSGAATVAPTPAMKRNSNPVV